tara:strand:- start:47 stop:664 length:618 start_codon:yes stop_codon:yes gene_type:complete
MNMIATETAKPMVTPEGQARNDEIFLTAAQLMVEKGYGATSISDIAKAVGMTKAGLYHHIRSKQDMLFQILKFAMKGLECEVIEPAKRLTDPEARLRETIRLHVRGLFKHGLEFSLLFPEQRHLGAEQQEVVTKLIENYLELLHGAMEELAAEGKLRDLDIKIASRHILQTIAGIARWYSKDTMPLDLLVEQTVNYNLSAILKDS